MYLSHRCECGAEFMVDATDSDEYTDQVWFFFVKWAGAHEACGWIQPSAQADEKPTKFVLGPMDLPEPTDVAPHQ